MANVTLFVRNIEVKGYTANLLIINQLQNGFIFSQPPMLLIINELCFTFLFYFINIIEKLLQTKYDVYWII